MLQTIADRGRALMARDRRPPSEQLSANLVDLCEQLLSGRGEVEDVLSVDRLTQPRDQLFRTLAGRTIVAVAHGGTIKAALALALQLETEAALAFAIDNCSITRLDHFKTVDRHLTGTAMH